MEELRNRVDNYFSATGKPLLLCDFLNDIMLLIGNKDSEESDTVSLMTVHASKGMEFKVVFVTGVEEGLFPMGRSSDSDYGLEEERRLLYVAITRAMSACFLSYSKFRTLNGRNVYALPSRFINDIDKNFIKKI